MSLDHQQVVLAGIVPDRKDLLLFAIQHLEEAHFPSEVPRKTFTLLQRYYDKAGGVLPSKVLSDLLERSDVEATQRLLYSGYYEELAALDPSDHEFKYSVDALKEIQGDTLTNEALVDGFEISQRGLDVKGTTLKGAKEAREYVVSQFARIDTLDNIEQTPEGDMRRESEDILQEYEDRKAGKTGKGVLTGIKSLDKATGGFHKGELSLICAYTNQGKSMLTTQTAWNAAVMQGVNVFFATSETIRATVRRRIVARHSRLSQFDYPKGLDSADIKNGTLSPKEEQILKDVVHDLDNNPNYGKLWITQFPTGASNAYFEARMKRVATEWDVGLGVVDYLALLRATQRRDNEREEFNQILRETKVFTTAFNDGQGVPIVSPWQMRQSDYKEALKTGLYGLASLSDTSEAEKSSDQIISMLGMPEKKNEVVLQFLKMRDGEIPSPVILETDFRSTYLTDKESGGSFGTGFFS